MRKLRVALLTT
ncbi:hypothetical protein BT101_25600 [Vibrio parahaemolyticus]|nr:hypothetical protein BT101_26215 [Vibrio parahaemolyticus]OKY32998.1 hypothetical protein BT101_25995 [Vibrio parahaemolyticus]OKY34109.1 hypothetical protein BT101_25600 [Vibrio parahaemolyticus]